ncbi:hypothetical protein O1R50_24340 [Glycomyces luteolus]|uniref:Septum formation-related domain-containing protein n=1 Tax=Glycomyces luteolus TaxID=2670330 RepID=A0A9X3T6D5_9ACTN|nr:hypothetical protein [Glycomyces luteolus]MDA1362770.1 hypothetical protein [Glycomyces luteolus]
MTVPPNYGPPPEQPQTPGYGYQSPYSGGQTPYGSQPQQPPYGGGSAQQAPYSGGGGQPPYGQEPGSPYGGAVLPPEPPKRNLGLIGGIVVGATVIVLGAVLLVTMNLQGKDKDDDTAQGGGDTSASENENTPEADATTPAEETDSEVGQCLPYESEVDGSGLGPLVPCSDATAFWEIKAQSYDVLDIAVDGEGIVTDTAPIYAMCGDGWGTNVLGEAWTKWDYVYSSGTLDSLYCLQAVGNPDPAEPDHLPIMPDVGDCFDDSDSWWSIDCSSDLALYTVVDTIMFDPVPDMSDEDAEAQGTNCGTDWYWEMIDGEGRTYGILCGNDV